MEKVMLKQGSDHLEDKILRTGEKLRVRWPDGTVQGLYVGVTGGRVFVTVNFRGVQLAVYLRDEGLEAERD
jgi:hypothetical protein